MGDRVGITTWPRHQNLFYLVTSSGLSFEIKAHGNAVIGLAKKPGKEMDYWICIGDGARCWIKKDEEHLKSELVSNILSNDVYRRFWLQWNAGSIKLGRAGEQKPIVSYKNKIPDLKYITFEVLNESNPVHWRFDLPPVLPKLKPNKPISGGKLRWVTAGDQLPDGAAIGGFENEILYIIKAPHRDSVTPGKFVPSEGVGYISWGGEAHDKSDDMEVLCGYDCTWVSTCGDRVPVGAVVGGYSENRLERLYVGRAVHDGHTIPGKVQPSHKVCYIPYEGREIAKKKYEILVEPSEVRSVNDTFLSDMHIDSSESEEDDTWQPDDVYEIDDSEDDGPDGDDDAYNDDMIEHVMAL